MIEITYHKEGDYFIPDLYLEKEKYEKDYQIGKYGHLRLEYLKSHKKAEYTILFMDCTLRKHIVETDKQAKKRFDLLMKKMLEKNAIDEKLKNKYGYDSIIRAGKLNEKEIVKLSLKDEK